MTPKMAMKIKVSMITDTSENILVFNLNIMAIRANQYRKIDTLKGNDSASCSQ